MTMSIVASNWGWPQYIYLALSLLTLAAYIGQHGKARPPYNGYSSLCDFLIGIALLTAGGFFA
jgi:hypothetical protein